MAKKIVVRNGKRGCLWWCGVFFLGCLAIAVLAYALCIAAGVGLWFLTRYCWRKLVVQAPDSKFVKKMSSVPPIVRQVAAGLVCAMLSLMLMAGLGNASSNTANDTAVQTTQTQKGKKAEKAKKKSDDKAATVTETEPDPATLTDLVVRFVDVGQGDATILEFPDGKTMLIDTPTGKSDVVKSTLRADGRSTIDWLVATHPDADHIGGLDGIISSMDIGSIWAPEANSSTQTYTRFLTSVSNKGMGIESAYAGRQIATGENYSIDILWPQRGRAIPRTTPIRSLSKLPTVRIRSSSRATRRLRPRTPASTDMSTF